MIKFENVNFKYARSKDASLNNVSLKIKKGETVLICGESGCGKTTLVRMINGLIPHYYEGEMSGKVYLNGEETSKRMLYETAKTVGSVFQNPKSQFFCVDSRSELAFGPENMGINEEEILKRIDKTVSSMNINSLMDRNIFAMSGGEKQKIACASVDTLSPKVCVLDEPSSNLSLEAIEDLKETLLMWKKEGKTIIVSEHRLYWLKDICDRVICLNNGEIIFDMPMKKFKNLPDLKLREYGLRSVNENLSMTPLKSDLNNKDYITFENFNYSYKNFDVLHIDKLEIPRNEVIAIVGPNGAGKSTFSKCICGLMKGFKGTAHIGGKKYKGKKLLQKSYMVMQDVNHQLFCETVLDEITLGMDELNEKKITNILNKLGLKSLSKRHPMSLSGGQKQRVAVASALLCDKEIILFDEPTSGLDFYNMEKVANLIGLLRGKKTVFIVTHDPDLIRRCATVVLHLEKGHIVNSNIIGVRKEYEKEEEEYYGAAVSLCRQS
ncbi:energy-coupling factor transport system ATP-binding protein [Acetitomaculum ruminis DSM 5522]|uniref:Energy-coupling factor transport system ATP-binding protein n=1 Tax=Acetitomaculum ruminis DSM 5522 TaxID=1120918 RepID=A0A1I0XIM7_9FIRM|nr:ABC transporter ATP-binding protein [Acetitomaculum ruminis]SFB00170.1 energy-coupling factor transport system ATP-binding protein [Acetitomaculum ruminis DSM 5522]